MSILARQRVHRESEIAYPSSILNGLLTESRDVRLSAKTVVVCRAHHYLKITASAWQYQQHALPSRTNETCRSQHTDHRELSTGGRPSLSPPLYPPNGILCIHNTSPDRCFSCSSRSRILGDRRGVSPISSRENPPCGAVVTAQGNDGAERRTQDKSFLAGSEGRDRIRRQSD